MAQAQSFCFVFVCQAGRLEVDALWLALSLQHFVRCEHELVAAIPVPNSRWGTPRKEITDQLQRMGVRLVEVENGINPDYPIGNKINCLSIATKKDKLVFVDSDILCMSEFNGGEEFQADFSAKPADLATFGAQQEEWDSAYQCVGFPKPKVGDGALPYFNAGLIAVPANVHFGETWREICLALDEDPGVLNKRPWLDQIGLPLAVQRLGLDCQELTERHNFPAHLKRIDESNPPVFFHYHSPKWLMRSGHAIAVMKRIGAEHPYIWELMKRVPDWEPLAKFGRTLLRERVASLPGIRHVRQWRGDLAEGRQRSRTPRAEQERNGIVTGLPRSGTSLYSALLNSIPNVVCLNELSYSEHTFEFYGRTRESIGKGLPVMNKYSGQGDLTTNTIAGGTQLEPRVLPVENDQFVLAHKLTLPYLNRLTELCDQGWKVWVLVRHPLFTIASWKRCPQHFGIQRLDPPGRELEHIEFSSTGADVRRVEVWNHYARLIHGLRDRLNIVRYEDLVTRPEDELKRFCDGYGLDCPKPERELESRNQAGQYPADPELRALVMERCELELFGYADDVTL